MTHDMPEYFNRIELDAPLEMLEREIDAGMEQARELINGMKRPRALIILSSDSEVGSPTMTIAMLAIGRGTDLYEMLLSAFKDMARRDAEDGAR